MEKEDADQDGKMPKLTDKNVLTSYQALEITLPVNNCTGN